MALNSAAMKAKFKARIVSGLQREFGAGAYKTFPMSWDKIANALSDIAMDIVEQIQTTAEVVPGIPVVVNTKGGPTAQSGDGVTSAPGKVK